MAATVAGGCVRIGVFVRVRASVKERPCEPFKSRHVLSIKKTEPNNACQVAPRTLTRSLLICRQCVLLLRLFVCGIGCF